MVSPGEGTDVIADEEDPAESILRRLRHAVDAIRDERLSVDPWRTRLDKAVQVRARRLVGRRSTVDDTAIEAVAVEVHDRVLHRCRCSETKREVRAARTRKEIEPAVAAHLTDVLDRYGPETLLEGPDDPVSWVARWADRERQRLGAPYGLLDPGHRTTLETLLDALDAIGVDRVRHLGGRWHEAEEIVQVVAGRLYQYMLRADRLGRDAPVVKEGSDVAFVRKAVDNALSDLRGRELRRSSRTPIDEIDPPDARAEERAAEVAWRYDRDVAGRRAQALSWAGAGTLGQVYDEQWHRLRSGPRAKPAVARRVAIASRLVAEQRQQSDLVIDGLPEALARPIDEDRGRWLRPVVNRVLGELDPEWGAAYGRRLPRHETRVEGVGGASEASNLSRLDDDCGGRPDDPRRPPDPFGERSARRHGVTGLLRTVYASFDDRTERGHR